MELFFNELSIKKENAVNTECVITLAKVYKELLKYNITTCRIGSADSVRLFQMIDRLPNSENVRNFYFSFFRAPYESETVEERQDEYYGHSWLCNGEECFGFALAFILDTAGISIESSGWNIPQAELLIDDEINTVRNICVKEHVNIHIPQLQEKSDIELIKCGLQPADKKIVLRRDHGMDLLEEFSKRLPWCPYLIGVVNSLPFNPNKRKFIKKIRDHGLIEIVLPWTDEGYGLVVKTTGRNMRETEKIAEIMEEDFNCI